MTYKIHIWGLVQGVGFRPLVYRLAMAKQYKGFVCNGNDGVHIEINASEKEADLFLQEIITNKPSLAFIHAFSVHPAVDKRFTSFEIIESNREGSPFIPLTPDYAVCDDCRREMNDPANRRYQYPFITCTACGPRYSVIRSLPYDRINTTMDEFLMCEKCAQEYHLATDRRYYAQTNSCTGCGITLSLFNNNRQLIPKGNKESLQQAVELLKQGNIVAVKGIGGYLLMCDAINEKAMQRLRDKKHRPHKPLAVLFSSVNDARQYCEINEREAELLRSAQSPIVLANIKQEAKQLLPLSIIAPGLDTLGVMMPYAPLFELISRQFGGPLIATSANISGSPVIYNDHEALHGLAGIADFILLNNREVLIPQDDSVLRVTRLSGRTIITRRSRGLSPSYFEYKTNSDIAILATGALMKSSFSISSNKSVYTSQYLGSTDSFEAQQAYRHTLQHVQKVLQVKPQWIIADKHPQYFSHELANELAGVYKTDVKFVQHHKAHFAAVLAENNLLHTNSYSGENVLGVIWDGTGFGDDGQTWGSEFFLYAHNEMKRCSHLAYYKHLLGDKMAKEPRLAALSVCEGNEEAILLVKEKFSAAEWSLYNNMLQQHNGTLSSSMGRLFDAVACLLGLCNRQSFEGQAAILLETAAQEYIALNGYGFDAAYTVMEVEDGISTSLFADSIVSDIINKEDKSYIAAKFHYSLVKLIEAIAGKMDIKQIACSGGVFQNALLADMLEYHLAGKYDLYFHKQLSPNDENISFGQLLYADNGIDKNKKKVEAGMKGREYNPDGQAGY